MNPLLINVILIAIAIVPFVYFILVIRSQTLKQKFLSRFGEENFSLTWHLFERIGGALLFGSAAVAAMILSPSLFSFPRPFAFTGKVFLTTIVLVLPVIQFNACVIQKAGNRENFPQIQLLHWNRSMIVINALSWFIYLFAYEILFRGILLAACLNLFDTPSAVIINVLVYAVLHLHKSAKETWLSIPFGFLLCMATIISKSILPAVFIHTAFAISYETMVIQFKKSHIKSIVL